MRDAPSEELLELLNRLGPELPRCLPAVAKSVRTLSGVLPNFDTVWVDALAKARLITPFQAREINCGRGSNLVVGPFVIQDRIQTLGYADLYSAGHRMPPANRPRRGRSSPRRMLLTCNLVEEIPGVVSRLSQLVHDFRSLESPSLCVISETGQVEGRIWLVADYINGCLASDWLAENGRLPPRAVLQVARQLLSALCKLETLGLTHGDLCAKSLMFLADGSSTLLFPGLRSVLRPVESLAIAELSPDCYETIAPERVTQSAQSSVVSDIFSYGCLLTQLLTGRPAIHGATALAKMSNLVMTRIADVRQLAPDTPPVLAEIILACTDPAPHRRPQTFREIAELLGPANNKDNRWVSHAITKPARWLMAQRKPERPKLRIRQHALEFSTAIICFAIAIASWKLATGQKSKSTTVPIESAQRASNIRTSEAADNLSPAHVVPASFNERIAEVAATVPETKKGEPLLLPTERVLHLSSLLPSEGQVVSGTTGNRATVVVPADGLDIEPSGVQFKDIDFLIESSNSNSAFISIRSANAQFENCTFSTSDSDVANRPAVQWQPSSNQVAESWSAETDRLIFVNCIFAGVSAGIERARPGEAEIEFRNVLCVNSGPLVKSSPPALNEQLKITLDHCTLRDVNSFLELGACNTRTGRVVLETRDCVLSPRKGNAHIEVESLNMLEEQNLIVWKGQGTLIDLESVLIATRSGDLEIEPLDELHVSVTGIARSQLQFAGPATSSIYGSKLQRWVAPRKSAEPPGVIFQALPAETARLTSDVPELRFQ